MYIRNPSKELDDILNRLKKYPVLKVNPKTAQAISRYKSIRRLSEKNHIWIRKGIISLPPNVKVKKNKKGYYIDIF
jgi:hypothetical protein